MNSTRQDLNGLQLAAVRQGKVELEHPEALVVGESFELDLRKVKNIPGLSDATLYDLIRRICSEHRIQIKSQQTFNVANYQAAVGYFPEQGIVLSAENLEFVPIYHAGKETKRALTFYVDMNDEDDLHVDLMKFNGPSVCLGRNQVTPTVLESGQDTLLVMLDFIVKPVSAEPDPCPVTVYHVGADRVVEGERVLSAIHVYGIDMQPSIVVATRRVKDLSEKFKYFKSYEYSEFLTEILEFINHKFAIDQVEEVIGHTIGRLGGRQELFNICMLSPCKESTSFFNLTVDISPKGMLDLVDRLQTQFGSEFCQIHATEENTMRVSLVAIYQHLKKLMDGMQDLLLKEPGYLQACKQYTLLNKNEHDVRAVLGEILMSRANVSMDATDLVERVFLRMFGCHENLKETGGFVSGEGYIQGALETQFYLGISNAAALQLVDRVNALFPNGYNEATLSDLEEADGQEVRLVKVVVDTRLIQSEAFMELFKFNLDLLKEENPALMERMRILSGTQQLSSEECAKKLCQIARRQDGNIEDIYVNDKLVLALVKFSTIISEPKRTKSEIKEADKELDQAITMIERNRNKRVVPSTQIMNEIASLKRSILSP